MMDSQADFSLPQGYNQRFFFFCNCRNIPDKCNFEINWVLFLLNWKCMLCIFESPLRLQTNLSVMENQHLKLYLNTSENVKLLKTNYQNFITNTTEINLQ